MDERQINWHELMAKAQATENKDTISRVQLFLTWAEDRKLQETPTNLLLDNYAVYLREECALSATTVRAYLASVVGRLRETGDPSRYKLPAPPASTAHDRLPFRDDHRLRLDDQQIAQLLAIPDQTTLKGLRDAALIALMLATGIRETEVVMLSVENLTYNVGIGFALQVPEADGCKERLIPYGRMDWVVRLVQNWMEQARIEYGPIFRGFYKNERHVRRTHMSIRTVENILRDYPITMNGEQAFVKPMDLRRTYTSRLYKAGIDLEVLQGYLGLSRADSVLDYVGYVEAKSITPPQFFGLPEA